MSYSHIWICVIRILCAYWEKCVWFLCKKTFDALVIELSWFLPWIMNESWTRKIRNFFRFWEISAWCGNTFPLSKQNCLGFYFSHLLQQAKFNPQVKHSTHSYKECVGDKVQDQIDEYSTLQRNWLPQRWSYWLAKEIGTQQASKTVPWLLNVYYVITLTIIKEPTWRMFLALKL